MAFFVFPCSYYNQDTNADDSCQSFSSDAPAINSLRGITAKPQVLQSMLENLIHTEEKPNSKRIRFKGLIDPKDETEQQQLEVAVGIEHQQAVASSHDQSNSLDNEPMLEHK